MQEQQKKLLFSSETNLSTVSSSGSMKESESTVNGGMFVQGGEFEWFGEGGSDDIDYDMSGFQSHSQINQLHSEMARLQVECQHWKDLARSKTQVSDWGGAMSINGSYYLLIIIRRLMSQILWVVASNYRLIITRCMCGCG